MASPARFAAACLAALLVVKFAPAAGVSYAAYKAAAFAGAGLLWWVRRGA